MIEEIILFIWAIGVTLLLVKIILSKKDLDIKYKIELNNIQNSFEDRIIIERKDAVKKSKSILKGKISEQIVSLFPEFYNKYEASDARFFGSPIDFIIFKNMSKFENATSEPIEIIILDIKTGNSQLTSLQRSIKNAVENGKVSFDVIGINKDED